MAEDADAATVAWVETYMRALEDGDVDAAKLRGELRASSRKTEASLYVCPADFAENLPPWAVRTFLSTMLHYLRKWGDAPYQPVCLDTPPVSRRGLCSHPPPPASAPTVVV